MMPQEVCSRLGKLAPRVPLQLMDEFEALEAQVCESLEKDEASLEEASRRIDEFERMYRISLQEISA